MKHGSICSGIGGFDLAAAWMGWENIFQVEKDPFCNTILARHFPNADKHPDVKTFNAKKYEKAVNVVSAGFPCQPYSVAGKRKGESDDRFLWPETYRIIREIGSMWIVLENVLGLLSILESESLSSMENKTLELYSQDHHQQPNNTIIRLQRRILGRIITDITSAGYILPRLSDGTPIILCVPAVAVGAVHRRDRLWIIAHSSSDTIRRKHTTTFFDQNGNLEIKEEEWKGQYGQPGTVSKVGPIADTDSPGLEGRPQPRNAESQGAIPEQHTSRLFEFISWDHWPTQSPVRGGDDGLPSVLDGITIPKWSKESIKGFGNAVVPQVAYEIFKVLQTVDSQML